MKLPSLERAFTQLITPFRDGEVDEAGLREFVDWQIACGAEGLAPCTLTGEGPTLGPAEHERAVAATVDVARGRAPVIAATGSNSTAVTIDLTRAARRAGADAALIVTPYYNRPSPEGVFRHVEAVARAVDIPLVLHLDPAHANIRLDEATLSRITALAAVAGVLDESDDLRRSSSTRGCAPSRSLSFCDRNPAAFAPDRTGRAWFSVAANVAPALCAEIARLRRAARMEEAASRWAGLEPLSAVFEQDGAPAALKYAVSLMHPSISPELRLPMTPPSPQTAALTRAGVAALVEEIEPCALHPHARRRSRFAEREIAPEKVLDRPDA